MDSNLPTFPLFRNDLEAYFLWRPNRFRVEVTTEGFSTEDSASNKTDVSLVSGPSPKAAASLKTDASFQATVSMDKDDFSPSQSQPTPLPQPSPGAENSLETKTPVPTPSDPQQPQESHQKFSPPIPPQPPHFSAHCPNPGRLMEFLFPGRRVILESRPDTGAARTDSTMKSTNGSTSKDLCHSFQDRTDRTEGGVGGNSRGIVFARKTRFTLVALYPDSPLYDDPSLSADPTLNADSPGSRGRYKEQAGTARLGAERLINGDTRLERLVYEGPGMAQFLNKKPGGPDRVVLVDRVVPVHAARLNRLVEALVLPRLFPGFQRAKGEARWGDSQFDFLVRDAVGTEHFLEVKSCTLVEYGVAMFPDAPSTRAVRHLRELADAARAGYGAHVIFILAHGPVERFIPNLHTDPEFAATLSQVSPWVQMHAVEIAANSSGRAWIERMGIPIDLSYGKLAKEDRGSYLLTLRLEERAILRVGSLGNLEFLPGWYVYAGSAQRGLSRRVARHLRKVRKKMHWHIDYLSAVAIEARAYPIGSYENLECALAEGLAEIGGVAVQGFGSTDCGCKSHLFYFAGQRPLQENRQFVDLVLRFRHVRFCEGKRTSIS